MYFKITTINFEDLTFRGVVQPMWEAPVETFVVPPRGRGGIFWSKRRVGIERGDQKGKREN